MSKMSDLAIDIQDRLDNGDKPEDIAKELDIPLEWVIATAAETIQAKSENHIGQSEGVL